MAASHAVLTYHDGKLDVPDELRSELQLSEGSRLRVIYSADGRVVLDSNASSEQLEAKFLDPVVPDWRALQGFLSHASRNPNDLLEEDRLREIELDAKPS